MTLDFAVITSWLSKAKSAKDLTDDASGASLQNMLNTIGSSETHQANMLLREARKLQGTARKAKLLAAVNLLENAAQKFADIGDGFRAGLWQNGFPSHYRKTYEKAFKTALLAAGAWNALGDKGTARARVDEARLMFTKYEKLVWEEQRLSWASASMDIQRIPSDVTSCKLNQERNELDRSIQGLEL